MSHEDIWGEENSRKKKTENSEELVSSRNNKEVKMLEKNEQGKK